jgi:hypothetical protein
MTRNPNSHLNWMKVGQPAWWIYCSSLFAVHMCKLRHDNTWSMHIGMYVGTHLTYTDNGIEELGIDNWKYWV